MGLIPETPVQQADIASAYGALGLFNGGASDLGGEPITMPTLPPFQQVFRPYRSPEPAYHPLTRITCELDPDCPLSRY